MAVAPSGRWAALGFRDGRVERLNLSDGVRKILPLSHRGRLTVSPEGEVIDEGVTEGATSSVNGERRAAVSIGGRVQVWDREGRTLRDETVALDTVYAVAFSPDGAYLVIGTRSGAWAGRTASGAFSRLSEISGPVQALSFSSDGRLFVLGAEPALRRFGRHSSRDPRPLPQNRPCGFLGIEYGGSTERAQIEHVVAGSSAALAGLLDGDLVTAVDDSDIHSAGDLFRRMQGAREGDLLHLRVLRRDVSHVFRVKLGRCTP